MTLPTSGSISTDQILAELRVTNPARGLPLSLTDADVLALAGKSTPLVLPNDLYGKSSYVAMSASMADVNMDAAANPGGSYIAHQTVTISVAGGIAPFSFAWAHVSGTGSVNPVNAASSTVNMTVARFSEPGEITTQVVRCTVTDGKGNQISRQCTVTMTLS